MSTMTPPPPAPPLSPPTAPVWRRVGADLLDLALVATVAAVVGGLAWQVALHGSDDPWAALGAALVALAASALVAFLGWVWLLVRVHRGRATPGESVLGLPPDGRVLWRIGRQAALVIAPWCAAVVAVGLVEPPPSGPAGAGVAGALGVGVGLAAAAGGGWRRALQVAGVAGAVCLAVAVAVPDRPPHPWELRDDVQTAMTDALVADPAAMRPCDGADAGQWGPCSLPDKEWEVARPTRQVTMELDAIAHQVVDGQYEVTVRRTRDGRTDIEVDGATVAVVSATGADCSSSRVVLAVYDPTPPTPCDSSN